MIVVIPARGGSQRIPGKNIKMFHGKPIIAYSIEIGSRVAASANRVIVSTDSDEIAAVATEYGAEVHRRPAALARDEIGTQEVIGYVCADLNLSGTVCGLYATSPLLTILDINVARLAHQHDPLSTFRYSADRFGKTTGGFFIGEAESFMLGLDPYAYGFPWHTDDIDINTPEDWSRAEKLYEARI